VSVLWEYRRCSSSEYAVITNGDAISCRACPLGGDCYAMSQRSSAVVESSNIVSQRGWWASPSSDGSRFYRCPIRDACMPGAGLVNGSSSRTRCADGFDGILCGSCALGYFPQYGTCAKCPASASPLSVFLSVLLPMVVVVAFGVLFVLRGMMGRGMMKVGLTMLQIIASANSAYSIPWPSRFKALLNFARLFLVDIISLTKADCASPVLYYRSLLYTLVGFKFLVLLIAVVMYAAERRRARSHPGTVLQHNPAARAPRSDDATAAATGGSVVSGGSRMRRSTVVLAAAVNRLQLARQFRAVFMVLFVAYPFVAQKILRMYRCRFVEGVYYLAADMRLRCFTHEWYGYATYAGVMAVVFVVGFPASILVILVRRRRVLFGDGSAETRRVYGFLYEAYGPVAWWWEVEELLRRLVLSAVVVLMDDGSPLQVTLAVLVSGWAHVLHAVYKPWGSNSRTYLLQHGSLFVTSFVFLMGLLFKVQGINTDSWAFVALAVVMLLLTAGFVAWWLLEMGVSVARTVALRRGRRHVKMLGLATPAPADAADGEPIAAHDDVHDDVPASDADRRPPMRPLFGRSARDMVASPPTQARPSVAGVQPLDAAFTLTLELPPTLRCLVCLCRAPARRMTSARSLSSSRRACLSLVASSAGTKRSTISDPCDPGE
jgi:hypothetical protein